MKIEWKYFSAKVQAHGLCRYCDNNAEYMNKRKDDTYDAVCKKHHKPNTKPTRL